MTKPRPNASDIERSALPGESWEQASARLERWRSWPRVMHPCVHNPSACNGFVEIGRDGEVCAGCYDGALNIDNAQRDEEELADALPALIASGEWALRVEEAKAAAEDDPIPF